MSDYDRVLERTEARQESPKRAQLSIYTVLEEGSSMDQTEGGLSANKL